MTVEELNTQIEIQKRILAEKEQQETEDMNLCFRDRSAWEMLRVYNKSYCPILEKVEARNKLQRLQELADAKAEIRQLKTIKAEAIKLAEFYKNIPRVCSAREADGGFAAREFLSQVQR